jgi:WhiB family transcriptional regulator, redox-sensing transcriptional regulator
MARSTSSLQPISEVWEWQLLGRCRDRSGTQFFHPDDDLGRISRRLREAAAKRLCGSCPVRRQCATHALIVGEEYGVWGGFSENDRYLLRELGWEDTLDRHRLADLDVLEGRMARAREKAQQERERRQKVRAVRTESAGGSARSRRPRLGAQRGSGDLATAGAGLHGG